MNLFDLFIKIAVQDEASDKIAKIAGSLGTGLSVAAGVATAAIGAAASGIAALTTGAVKNYAEYEQLVGGVDTLFKTSSQKVQEYAANAYKTAGVSANTYMATVTSFSASLLQSLGGDTEAAADLANRALTDMSDNANKMGTDMNTIINTYQSLSRGNYAMLDNLKLGYGGTKAEMERLIATAAELDSSVKANDMSFGNMVKAIGVIQDEMGITGTTALEASTTIQGSVNSMKAAWQNLMTGIADENANFSELVGNFVESAGVAAENILPRITIALQGAARLINTLLPPIIQQIPAIVTSILPQMVTAAVGIVQALVDGIIQNAELLVSSAYQIIDTLINAVITLLPTIIEMGMTLILALVQGLAENIDQIVPVMVDCVLLMASILLQNIPALLTAGVQLIGGLLSGLVQAIPSVLNWIVEQPKIFAQALIAEAPALLSAGAAFVENLNSGFVLAWNSFMATVKGLINELLGAIAEAAAAIGGFFGQDWNINMPKISTTFEQDKIRDASRDLGKYGSTTIYNINNPKTSAADFMKDAKYRDNRNVMLGT